MSYLLRFHYAKIKNLIFATSNFYKYTQKFIIYIHIIGKKYMKLNILLKTLEQAKNTEDIKRIIQDKNDYYK